MFFPPISIAFICSSASSGAGDQSVCIVISEPVPLATSVFKSSGKRIGFETILCHFPLVIVVGITSHNDASPKLP